MGKQYNLVDIEKVVEPIHMTHAMNIIELEGWSVEQEKDNEYCIGEFSTAGQDFSIVMQGTTDEFRVRHFNLQCLSGVQSVDRRVV